MLDIKYIRENKDAVNQAAVDKGREVDLDRILALDEQRKTIVATVDNKRAERNKLAKVKMETDIERMKARKLKEEVKELEKQLVTIEKELTELMLYVPNVPDKIVPVGGDASANLQIKQWGSPTQFDTQPLDHMALVRKYDLVDFERGAKIGGFRTYFLKNEAAMLEVAILSYTFQKLIKKGYTPIIAPSLVRDFTLTGSGQFPWGREEVYHLEKDDMYLAGTAEVPVTAYFANEVLNEKDLPKKFVALSPCFRREAGSYGRDTKGLYRLHQFNKVEQVIINKNDYESSIALHEELLQNSEEVLQDLKLPYRVMLMCTGDMGEPQVKKYDIETWMPSRHGYGETMSNSFMGEFQARRLNMRYRTKQGMIQYCHTLNNTAVASPRILIAILENYQQSDGSILIPEVLRGYLGKNKIGPS